MFPPTQRTNKWVIPHTRAKAQVKPLFLSPKLAEGPSEARRNNEKGWICSSDWFIVNIYSFIPVQSRLGPCKDKTAVSKLSPVEAVTCHASSCAIPLRLWQGTQRETGRGRCAIRASRRRKQSTVGLYWINSNIEDMSREEGRECSKKNKPQKKSLKYEPSEFQKQLQNSRFPVQEMWDSSDSGFTTDIQETGVGLNK